MEKLFKPYIFLHLLLLSAFANAQSIGIRVPDTTMVEGQEILVPVYADSSFTGKGVLSYQLQLQYADYYLQPIEVVTTGGVAAQFGSATVNISQTTLVNIAGAGSIPLTGKGVFLYIRFKALHSGGSSINYTGAAKNYFNEGTPSVDYKYGYLQIGPAPKIYITPNSADLLLGDSLQMSVYGDTVGPFTYTVLNPSAATISSKGLLKTLSPGITKVQVEDSHAVTDLTDGNIQVFGYRLSAPPDIKQWQGGYVNIPIYTTDLTGLNVFSGNFTFNYYYPILEFVQILTDTTILNGVDVQVNSSVNGALTIAFASGNVITGKGVLLYLRFHVSTINTGSSGLSFTNVMFNENLPALVTSGYFSTINYANIGINPNSATILAGDSLQITATNGVEPYTYESTNSQIATISNQGMLTTIRGGVVQVIIKDSVGAQKTSGYYTVYDTYVQIPDTTSPVNSSFNLPVYLGSLPAEVTVSSVEISFLFNDVQLEFVDLVQLGTLSEGWSIAKSLNGNTLDIAGAGATAMQTGGILFYLKFNLTGNMAVDDVSNVTINQYIFNEGSPSALKYNGSIRGTVKESPCKADFTYGYTGSTVSFTGNATGIISGYRWDFGDGTYDSIANPEHTYTNAGVYTITFTVADSVDDCMGSTSKTIMVPENAPGLIQAQFTYAVTGNFVDFANTSLGSYTDAFWDFGDGAYSTNFSDSHIYGALGNYNVTLTIYNGFTGNMNQITQMVSVTSEGSAQCVANFTFMGDQNTVAFQSTSSGEPTDFFWDFGDGKYSFDQNPINIYDSAGYYNVTLSIYNSANQCFDAKSAPVVVYIASTPMCKAAFSYYPVGNTVYFTSTSLGDYSQHFWDFGDGFNSNEIDPEHTFDKPGYYEIAYSVIDTVNGCFDTETKTIFVPGSDIGTGSSNIKADFSYMPESNSNMVMFTDKSMGNVTNWYWDFGDNTPASNLQSPTYTYSTNDYYRVCLTAGNSSDQSSKCSFIAVGDISESSTAYYTYFADSVTATARFRNQSLGNIVGYLWDFGDGNSSLQKNPSHTYADTGYYAVCLTTTSKSGIQKTYCNEVRIGNSIDNPCLFSCVWPGDANNDLEANHYDIMTLGLNYGMQGPKRENASTEWYGQSAQNWSTHQLDGTNNKHGDCNGDGAINADDLQVLEQNFAYSHYWQPDTKSAEWQIGCQWEPEGNKAAGSRRQAKAILISEFKGKAGNMYGLGYEVEVVGGEKIVWNSIKVSFDNSWIGVDGKNMLTITQMDSINHMIYIGMARTDQTDTLGSGEIARFDFEFKPGYNATGVSFNVTTKGGIVSSGQPKGIVSSISLDLASPQPICGGKPAVLDAGAGFETYTWSTGATDTSRIEIDTPGVYYVTVSNSQGATASDSIVVDLRDSFAISLGNDVTQNDSVILDAGSGNFLYLWSTGENTQTITVKETGEYWVQVMNEFGCTATDTIQVTIITGINAQTDKNITVFPNPNNGKFWLVYEFNPAASTVVEIVNTNGKTVWRSEVKGYSGRNYLVGADRLAKGVYLLKVVDNNRMVTKRFVIL